jgi:methyl-accepting chemotaxis protein
MNWIYQIRVKNRFLLLIAMATVCILSLQSISLMTLKTNLLEDRMLKTQHIIEAAFGVLEYYYQQEQDGSMTRQKAQNSARNTIKLMRYDSEQYFWINDMHPRMIMHPLTPQLDGTDISNITDPNGKKLFTEMTQTVQKSKFGFVNYQWKKFNESSPTDKISFVKGFAPWGWVLGSGIYIDDVTTIFWENALTSILLTLTSLFVMLWFSWIIARTITRPISDLNRIMEQVSLRKDLTLRAEIQGSGELSQIGSSFNYMLTAFQNLINEVSSSISQLAMSAEKLSAVTRETNKGIQKQHLDIDLVATAMVEMAATVNEVSKNTESTSDATKLAHKEATSGHHIVSNAKSTIDELAVGVEQASVVVYSLENDSGAIGKILDVIRAIAEQTNLLALNAAIEAARAGEQGRGFAVVADEVRTLAKRTQDSIEEIESMIKSLQKGTRKAVAAMDNGKEMATTSVQQIAEVALSLDKINENIETINEMSLQIATAADQQSTVTNEISRNITEISGVALVTAQGAEQTSSATNELADLAEKLREVTGKFIT